MRSSSVKTLVSAVTLTFTLIVAAPPAEARPSQPSHASQSAPVQPGVTARAQRAIRQLLQRVMRITASALPTDPWPIYTPGTSGTPEALPTDPWPTREQ